MPLPWEVARSHPVLADMGTDSAGSGVVPTQAVSLPLGDKGIFTQEEAQVLVIVGQVSEFLPAVLWRQVAAERAALWAPVLPGKGLARAKGPKQL